MLQAIYDNTLNFLESMPKNIRKKKGQFFTSMETAEFMANMFDLSYLKEHVKILDPGSGTGILSAAIIRRLEAEKNIQSIHLVCYETDTDVLPLLKSNVNYMMNTSNIDLSAEVREEDYLLTQCDDFHNNDHMEEKYDLIIGNPPYLKVLRNHPAAIAMPEVVHGSPNLYFLFAAMSLYNLKDDGEMVYIVPRSWTSGAYFKAFREYFLGNGKLEQIHLFVSRDQVFKEDQVLQETIIIKVKKTLDDLKEVKITSSHSSKDFHKINILHVPYDVVVTGKDRYVYLPACEDDIETIKLINQYSNTFPDEGIRMRTGIVVDFREKEHLRKTEENAVPLFYSQHIREGKVNHEISGKEYDWISTDKRGLVQKNKNYVFCKRFTAKEERRRLQCGIYLSEEFPEYEKIGTQNKINYIDDASGEELKIEEVYGVYALLNSTLFDKYYRVLNGSTQVNSTEINSIPVPPREIIQQMGAALLKASNLSTETCDLVLKMAYKNGSEK